MKYNEFTNSLSDEIKKSDYFYLFLLLSFSGNPIFVFSNFSKILFVITTLFLIIKHHSLFKTSHIKILYIFLSFYFFIFFFQFMTFHFISIEGAANFLLKSIFGFIIIMTVGSKFKIVYFNTIYYISLISLFGYLWNYMGYDIPSVFEIGRGRNIILFHQIDLGDRNSGIFWEPGAFACYITFGFLLFLGEIRNLISSNKWKIIIILTALFTTFSTTGYIVLFIIIVATIIIEYHKKNIVVAIALLATITISGYIFFNKSEILKDKIISQYEYAIDQKGEFAADRFSSFMFDLHYIKKHPLIGNGLHSKTRLADHPLLINKNLGAGNGFSNFISCMGVLSLLLISYYIIKHKKKNGLLFVLIIYIILQGEDLMNYPLFLSIPFIYIKPDRLIKSSNNRIVNHLNKGK